MNTQKVLIGTLLAQPDLAPYSLPELDMEHFAPDLQPVFAAVSGFWNSTGTLDAVQICARYPDQKAAIMSCFDEWTIECVRATRSNVEKWTQIILEQAALTKFQSLAIQAGSSVTTFADLSALYDQMGEALTLDREEQDFKSIGELVDDYISRLDEKTSTFQPESRCWTRICTYPPATCLSSAVDRLPVKLLYPCKSPVNRPGGVSVCAISRWRQTPKRSPTVSLRTVWLLHWLT